MNNISNRSSVLSILCEHEQFSAIDYSGKNSVGPYRLQALDGRRVDDETRYWVVLSQHLTSQKLTSLSKVTSYQ